MPGLKATNDSEVRKSLVAVRYHKLAGEPWRRVGRKPEIETYSSDVSEMYREPQVERVTPTRAIIRVFDEQAVDLSRLIEQFGDYTGALARCDECFRKEVLGNGEADLDSYMEPWY